MSTLSRNRRCSNRTVSTCVVLSMVLLHLPSLPVTVVGFAVTTPLFQPDPVKPKTAPAEPKGVPIEMPNFEELFKRIQEVSPLARQVIEQKNNGERGLEYVDDSSPTGLHWKQLEANKRRTVFHIDKIDNYMQLGPPLVRYRASLEGPCIGDVFANFITDLKYRKKWDSQIAESRELYLVHDLDTVNKAMDSGKYGECTRFGVGYCKTRKNLGISPREQLTLCGIQDFKDGSSIIWGTEMEEWHNHLFPEGRRVPRAKSHLFCTTLVPTDGNKFDVEYLLQMDIGGIPNWIGTPLLIDSVKHLFKYAEAYYAGGEDGEVYQYALEKAKRDSMLDGGSHSFLMPQ